MKFNEWEKGTLLTIFSHEMEWVENNLSKAEIKRYKKLQEKLENM